MEDEYQTAAIEAPGLGSPQRSLAAGAPGI